jgi:hypothetical protein
MCFWRNLKPALQMANTPRNSKVQTQTGNFSPFRAVIVYYVPRSSLAAFNCLSFCCPSDQLWWELAILVSKKGVDYTATHWLVLELTDDKERALLLKNGGALPPHLETKLRTKRTSLKNLLDTIKSAAVVHGPLVSGAASSSSSLATSRSLKPRKVQLLNVFGTTEQDTLLGAVVCEKQEIT